MANSGRAQDAASSESSSPQIAYIHPVGLMIHRLQQALSKTSALPSGWSSFKGDDRAYNREFFHPAERAVEQFLNCPRFTRLRLFQQDAQNSFQIGHRYDLSQGFPLESLPRLYIGTRRNATAIAAFQAMLMDLNKKLFSLRGRIGGQEAVLDLLWQGQAK